MFMIPTDTVVLRSGMIDIDTLLILLIGTMEAYQVEGHGFKSRRVHYFFFFPTFSAEKASCTCEYQHN